ncbi:putative phosphatase regulatory subunit-domain-containing protein, partial [Endogone sp. FLAS-F59071]
MHLFRGIAVFICVLQLFALATSLPVPTSAQVELNTYQIVNNYFSGQIYIENLAYAKVVTVYYSTAANVWNVTGDSIAASYSSSISGTNYEYWVFNASIGSQGISEFYIQYQVNGTSYYDNNSGNNYKVSSTTSISTTSSTTATSKTSTTTSKTTTSTTATSTSTTPWADRVIYQ